MSRVKNESGTKCETGVSKPSTFFEIQAPTDLRTRVKKGGCEIGVPPRHFPYIFNKFELFVNEVYDSLTLLYRIIQQGKL